MSKITETTNINIKVEYTETEDGVLWSLKELKEGTTDVYEEVESGESEDMSEARAEVLSEITSML